MVDLLSTCSDHKRIHNINPYVFYHPGLLNTMANDTSRRFNLSPHPFLDLFCSKYPPQYTGSWTMRHPRTKALSSVISVLRKHPYAATTYPKAGPSPSTTSGLTSTLTCRATTRLRMGYYPMSISLKCMDTGSVMVTTHPDPSSSGRTRLQRCGMLLPRNTFCRAAVILENSKIPTPSTSTSA